MDTKKYLSQNVFIIAETAFNHMGNIDYIFQLIKRSNEIGVKKITFQILHPENFSTLDYSKYKFSKKVEINYKDWEKIYYKCQKYDIEFIPCFLDVYSLNQLSHLDFKHIKIHATDLFNVHLNNKIKQYAPENLILETQVCNLHDVDIAIKQFDTYKGNLILFHGFSDYPTQLADLNMKMMQFLKSKYNLQVGFADHTLDSKTIPLMAIAFGASYIEKHITIERKESDFDYQVSLNLFEFNELIKNVKKYTIAIGDDIKYPVGNELKYKEIIHKKVRITKDLKKSDKISLDNIDFVRSDFGICAGKQGVFLNKTLNKTLKKGTIIEEKNIFREKIVIPIIARLKSKRLPLKILKEINGQSLLGILIKRLKTIENENIKIVLATSYLEEDKPLISVAKKYNIDYYLGDPENVLDRLVNIAEKYDATGIVRVTGDNILTDMRIVDILIKEFCSSDLEYIRTSDVPLGISPEIFSINCLYKIYDNMGNPNKSEYLTLYANLPEMYKVGVLKLDEIYYSFNNRFSIDTIEDFNYLMKFNDFLISNNKNIVESHLNDLAKFIKENPIDEIEILNKSFKIPSGQSMTYKEFNSLLKDLEKKSILINYKGRYNE